MVIDSADTLQIYKDRCVSCLEENLWSINVMAFIPIVFSGPHKSSTLQVTFFQTSSSRVINTSLQMSPHKLKSSTDGVKSHHVPWSRNNSSNLVWIIFSNIKSGLHVDCLYSYGPSSINSEFLGLGWSRSISNCLILISPGDSNVQAKLKSMKHDHRTSSITIIQECFRNAESQAQPTPTESEFAFSTKWLTRLVKHITTWEAPTYLAWLPSTQ